MPKETWIFASVLTVLLVVGVLGYSSRTKSRQIERLVVETSALRAQLEQTTNRVVGMDDELSKAKARLEELAREKESITQARTNLEQEMRAKLESKDITISELQGKLTVNILDRVLFDSGEAVLKPEGEKVIQQVANVLSQYPSRQIHVIGHTDNIPIRASAQSRFPSNWELSTARATAAVRFLQEKAGVDARRLGAVGYGEHRPVADNATSDGRAKNRRIAIVVLSDEIVGADAPASVIGGPTNNSATQAPTTPEEDAEKNL